MTEIDTSLYDRQIRTYGVDALKKITNSSITIVGLENGLSTEIVKNLALGGVKTIGLYDNNLITYADVETGFYYSEKDIGKVRSEVLIPKVQELNPYVILKQITSEDDFIANSILIIVNKSTSEISRLENKFGYRTIAVFSKGVAGMVFVNAGKKHVVLDIMGENIEPVQIGSIDSTGKLQCAPNTSHDFQSGDYIKFSNLEGDNVNKLSDKEFKIQVISPTCFKLELNDDLTNVKLNNGTAILIKKPIEVNHQPFSEQVKSPSFNFSFDDSTKIFNSLTRYIDNEENLKTENPWSDTHNQKLSCNFCAQDIDLVRTFSSDFLPVHSLVGSVAASETIKLITNKYLPINQFWCWYEPNMIIKNKPTYLDVTTLGLNSIARLYGTEFEKELGNSSWFLVGSGAIGCELLKNLVYLGVSSNEGKIYITDPDTIEKSNLNRQFLFRSHHINKPKSLMAAASISNMKKVNITAYTEKVCKENQTFSDSVMKNVTGVFNALDNIHARRYMDEQCFYNQKPLFESGTTGTKGSTQPVIPFLTETYSNSADPPQEKSFPICTIKNFPNEIQHTIHWAMDYFELFNRAPQNIMKWLKDSTVFNQGVSNDNSQGKEDVMNFLIKLNIKTFDSCIERAIDMFYVNYKNSILQLLTTYPANSKNEDGQLFWSNGKRAPKSLDRYDSSDENQLNYIEATAHLLARVYNINDSFDREYVKRISSEYKYNDVFKPDDKLMIAKNDMELKQQKEQISNEREILLPNNSEYLELKLNAQEFEKDDSTNWHVSFITAASNLRAINYGIPTASYEETKGIAGRIIPAIATTTSVVSGLIVLEMFKYMLAKYEIIENKIDNYRSTFVNLADTTLVYSEPIPAGQIEIAGNKFNNWTRFEYYQNTTLSKFKEYFENVFKTSLSMIVYDNKIVYADFMDNGDVLETELDVIIKSKNEDVNFSNSVILTIASTDDSINLPEIHFLLYPTQNKIASI
jgi:ubiquitin-activating enzyme E1